MFETVKHEWKKLDKFVTIIWIILTSVFFLLEHEGLIPKDLGLFVLIPWMFISLILAIVLKLALKKAF